MKYAILVWLLTVLSGTNCWAGVPVPEPCTGKDCESVAKLVCFNLLCNYEESAPKARYRKCESAARFEKWVTGDGSEIPDISEHPLNPEFEVACDDELLFNNSAYRYTDALGTRLQAQAGPYPATLLPRGALREGHRYVLSTLELNGQTLRGHCYIYTGYY
ncbi:MAG: hypothetical protein A2X94_09010 [Bdellovibrionales bacterium GWB1_55_8]|nr:MAG: hypothetical protein A2X94_09010 [Bdellovibrionales bacterium GWB1_55_8]